MKLASYRDGAGASFGVVTEAGLIDIGRRDGGRWPTLRAAIEAGALDEIAEIAASATPDVDVGAIDWLPPVPNPGHILCAGRNYRDHVLEMGGEIPTHPTFFSRHPNTLVAHEGALVRPRVSTHLDFEGELAFVLARGGATSRPRTRSTTSPAMPVSTTARCATGRSIRRPRARISSAPGHSARGW